MAAPWQSGAQPSSQGHGYASPTTVGGDEALNFRRGFSRSNIQKEGWAQSSDCESIGEDPQEWDFVDQNEKAVYTKE